MPRHQRVGILQKRVDAGGQFGKGRIILEFLILVGQNESLRALSVGQMKPALRVDENILFFQNMKLFVRQTVAECADLRGIFEHAGTLDVKKEIFHYLLGVMTFLPPIYGCNTAGIVTLPSACKWFSTNAISMRGGATTVLLSVCASFVFPSESL